MPEDEIFEEKIELAPKERVSLLMLESAQRRQLNDFMSFELKPGNLKEFMAMRRQATFDNILTINEIENEKLEYFKIHPDFKAYFKTVMDKKDKKKVEEHHAKWHGFLRQDWKDAFSNLMKKESQYQPRVALMVELLLQACQKYEKYIFSAVPSMQKAVMPSFGKGRTKLAYELNQQGKKHNEIAQILGIQANQVSQYIKIGRQSAEKHISSGKV